MTFQEYRTIIASQSQDRHKDIYWLSRAKSLIQMLLDREVIAEHNGSFQPRRQWAVERLGDVLYNSVLLGADQDFSFKPSERPDWLKTRSLAILMLSNNSLEYFPWLASLFLGEWNERALQEIMWISILKHGPYKEIKFFREESALNAYFQKHNQSAKLAFSIPLDGKPKQFKEWLNAFNGASSFTCLPENVENWILEALIGNTEKAVDLLVHAWTKACETTRV